MKNLSLLFITLVFCSVAFADSEALSCVTSNNNEEMTWCIARPSNHTSSLYTNINFSSNQSGVDCSSTKKVGSHASFAMNLYCRSEGKNAWNCNFRGTGLIFSQNTSLGSCYNEGAQAQGKLVTHFTNKRKYNTTVNNEIKCSSSCSSSCSCSCSCS